LHQVQFLYWIHDGCRDSVLAVKGYGQYCPVAKATEILNERWTLLVLRELLFGSRRFNDLRKGVPLMSPTLLSKRLKFLEESGVIERGPAQPGKGREYQPTTAGQELRPLIEMLGVWGQRWVRSRLTPDELDPGLLMWDIRRCTDAKLFPSTRTVVQFEFSDAAPSKRRWWLVVSAKDGVDLCLTDPGFEVDLYIVTDLRTMTALWMGDMPLRYAFDSGRIDLDGSPELRRSLRSWLQRSPFGNVPNQNPERNISLDAKPRRQLRL
jgi:DNA-binding HxlR family transcriptional regulator